MVNGKKKKSMDKYVPDNRIIAYDVLKRDASRIIEAFKDEFEETKIFIDEESISDEDMSLPELKSFFTQLYDEKVVYDESTNSYIIDNLRVYMTLPYDLLDEKSDKGLEKILNENVKNTQKEKKKAKETIEQLKKEIRGDCVVITDNISEVRKYRRKGYMRSEAPKFSKYDTDDLKEIGFEKFVTDKSYSELQVEAKNNTCKLRYLDNLLKGQRITWGFSNKYVLINYKTDKKQVLFKTKFNNNGEIYFDILTTLGKDYNVNYRELFNNNKGEEYVKSDKKEVENEPERRGGGYISDDDLLGALKNMGDKKEEHAKEIEEKKLTLEEKLLQPIFTIYPNELQQGILLNDVLRNTYINIGMISGSGGTGKSILTFLAGFEQTLSLIKDKQDDYKEGKHIYDQMVIVMPDSYFEKYPSKEDQIKNLPYKQHFVKAGFYEKNFNRLFDNSLTGNFTFDFKTPEGTIKHYLPNPRQNTISIVPASTFEIGTTYENTYMIIDECQNLTPWQVQMITKSQGENSKYIFLGDAAQIDPKNKQVTEDYNGLWEMVDKYEVHPYYRKSAYIRLNKDQRSEGATLAAKFLKQTTN